jgi:hypothetical protein
MENYKTIISIVATIIGLASYVPYLTGTLRGTIKPNPASWMVWGILAAVAFAGQLVSGGGIGTLITGTSAFASFFVMAFAMRGKGSRQLSQLDWTCLGASALAVAMWPIANSPLLSVALVSAVTLVGYIPTYAKSYARPHEENVSMYLVGIIKYVMAAIALSQYSAVTLLYPVVVVIANTALLTLMGLRRKQLALPGATLVEAPLAA